jgi:hypothetical protein
MSSAIDLLAKFVHATGKRSSAVFKKATGTRFRLGLIAIVLFALAYVVETKAVLTLESSQDLFEVMH